MAFGQIDPARLEGDALRRWYLRSPQEIEEERKAKTARAYDAFFSLSNRDQQRKLESPAKADGIIAAQSRGVGQGAEVPVRRAGEATWAQERSAAPRDLLGQGYKVAAASPRGLWDYWSPQGCSSCHGYTPDTLPPVGGRSPSPTDSSPGLGGSGRSNPGRRQPKQCDLQYESDSRICGRQPSPQDIAICRASASERLGYCIRTNGEVGQPPLDTARRFRPR
jgi:mono/diheme cytochrome c family protein